MKSSLIFEKIRYKSKRRLSSSDCYKKVKVLSDKDVMGVRGQRKEHQRVISSLEMLIILDYFCLFYLHFSDSTHPGIASFCTIRSSSSLPQPNRYPCLLVLCWLLAPIPTSNPWQD